MTSEADPSHAANESATSQSSADAEGATGSQSATTAHPSAAESAGERPAPPANAGVSPERSGRSGLWRRVLRWFWVTEAASAPRAQSAAATPRSAEFLRRASLTLEVARMTLDPPSTLEHAPASSVVCELCRQAIHWVLLAHRELRAPSAAAAHSDHAAPARPDFATLWSAADPALLRRVAGSDVALSRLGQSLEDSDFVRFAELPAEQADDLARKLCEFAQSLLSGLDAAHLESERIWLKRTLRVGLAVTLLTALVISILVTSDSVERSRDLAGGKPWTASSRYHAGGCTSPGQTCDDLSYFFHTQEEQDPWLVIDLRKVETISGIRVLNRADCCPDRAVPLIVEVSRDQKNWKKVARRNSDFTSWNASFSAVSARYVKLHVPRKTHLHLKEVRILR